MNIHDIKIFKEQENKVSTKSRNERRKEAGEKMEELRNRFHDLNPAQKERFKQKQELELEKFEISELTKKVIQEQTEQEVVEEIINTKDAVITIAFDKIDGEYLVGDISNYNIMLHREELPLIRGEEVSNIARFLGKTLSVKVKEVKENQIFVTCKDVEPVNNGYISKYENDKRKFLSYLNQEINNDEPCIVTGTITKINSRGAIVNLFDSGIYAIIPISLWTHNYFVKDLNYYASVGQVIKASITHTRYLSLIGTYQVILDHRDYDEDNWNDEEMEKLAKKITEQEFYIKATCMFADSEKNFAVLRTDTKELKGIHMMADRYFKTKNGSSRSYRFEEGEEYYVRVTHINLETKKVKVRFFKKA